MQLLKEIWLNGPGLRSGGDEDDPEYDAFESWLTDYSKEVDHYISVSPIFTLLGLQPHSSDTQASIKSLVKLVEKYKSAVVREVSSRMETKVEKHCEQYWERHHQYIPKHKQTEHDDNKLPSFFNGQDGKPNMYLADTIAEVTYDVLFDVIKDKTDSGNLLKILEKLGMY
jgi:hypothetical protein